MTYNEFQKGLNARFFSKILHYEILLKISTN